MNKILDNYEFLVEQFKLSRGLEIVDINSKSFLEEFSCWLKERRNASVEYMSILASMGINAFRGNSVELEKGLDDSAVLSYETKLLTPYIDGKLFPEGRVMEGYTQLNNKHGMIVYNGLNGDFRRIFDNEFDTVMIHNPYDFDKASRFIRSHNFGFVKMVIGVYGNISDKDRVSNIKYIDYLKNQLTNEHFLYNNSVSDENYSCLIASDPKHVMIRIRKPRV